MPGRSGRDGTPRTGAHRIPDAAAASLARRAAPRVPGTTASSRLPATTRPRSRARSRGSTATSVAGSLTSRCSHLRPARCRRPDREPLARGRRPEPVYDRAHADLPRSRGDDAGPPRGPRRDAPVPDRGLRQPELGPLASAGGARRARRRPRARRDAARRARPARSSSRRAAPRPTTWPQGRRLGGQGARPPDRDLGGRAPRRRPHAALPREVRLRGRRAAGRSLRPGRSRPARGGDHRPDDPRLDHAREQRGRDDPADRRDRARASRRVAASSSHVDAVQAAP